MDADLVMGAMPDMHTPGLRSPWQTSGRCANVHGDGDCPAWLAFSTNWKQRVGPFSSLPAELRRRGVDPVSLLSESGLHVGALDEPDGRVSFAALVRVLEAAARQPGCSDIGLAVGGASTLRLLGTLGSLLRAGPTVGHALQSLVNLQRLHGEGLAAFSVDHGHCVEVGFVALAPGSVRLATLYDTAAAMIAACVHEISGGAVRPTGVALPHRIDDRAVYRAHFGSRVLCQTDHAALFFEKRALALDVMEPDPGRRCEIAIGLKLPADDLVTRLYRGIRLQFAWTGSPRVEDFAAQVGISARSLSRRLAERGLSFSDVLRQVRYDLSRQLLAETDRQMCEVASACGYRDGAPFQRTFRRWSGTSPGRWRSLNSPDLSSSGAAVKGAYHGAARTHSS